MRVHRDVEHDVRVLGTVVERGRAIGADFVPDVGERSPGCRLRLDLVDAVAVLVRRRSRPTHIIVAVPDVPADPAASSVTTVVHTVLSDPDLRRWGRLVGVVATLDAVPVVTRLRTGSAVVDPTGAGQLESIEAWHGAPEVRPDATTPPGDDPAAEVVGAPDLVVIEQQGILDPGGVEEWLDQVLSQHAPRLVRLQGALAVDGSPSRVCCHGVGSYAMSHPEHEHPDGRRSATSVVMLIGHGLPADELAAGLRATAVR